MDVGIIRQRKIIHICTGQLLITRQAMYIKPLGIQCVSRNAPQAMLQLQYYANNLHSSKKIVLNSHHVSTMQVLTHLME